jgi:phosphoserine phosphatase
MNLILQGPNIDLPAVEHLAALAGAQRIKPLTPCAYRCEEVAVSPALKKQIEAECFTAGIDCALIAPGLSLSDFKLVAMDMDSTLITIECIDEIADMQGLKPQVAEITEAAMRGDIEFPESLARRVALLQGLDASALERVYEERLSLSLGASAMLETIQAAGLKTLLVSGGFTFFTDRMKARLGLDYSHANVLEIADGKLTGKVIGTVVDADEKRQKLEQVCTQLGITAAQSIVMGDGANDLKMMAIAGMSVAFRAKPVVRAQADVALNFVGLDGILTLLHK